MRARSDFSRAADGWALTAAHRTEMMARRRMSQFIPHAVSNIAGDAVSVALTIAGSDPSGGAGIQADLKTFHRFGVYGEAVPTLITVQNTRGVRRVEVLPGDLIYEQICAVLEDMPPAAAKTGALGSRAVVEAVARAAEQFQFPLIVDPVMISKNGAA